MKALSRPLRNEQQQWFIEDANSSLIEQLNHQPLSSSAKRLQNLIDLIKEARQLNCGFRDFFASHEDLRDFFTNSPELVRRDLSAPTRVRIVGFKHKYRLNPGLDLWLRKVRAHDRRLNTVISEISRIVGRFRFRLFLNHNGSFGVSSFFDIGHDVISKVAAHRAEAATIGWLLNHINHIEILRRCEECRKWFTANTNHQRFCSDPCRKRHASRSEEFKAERARYMREDYRPLVKKLEKYGQSMNGRPKAKVKRAPK